MKARNVSNKVSRSPLLRLTVSFLLAASLVGVPMSGFASPPTIIIYHHLVSLVDNGETITLTVELKILNQGDVPVNSLSVSLSLIHSPIAISVEEGSGILVGDIEAQGEVTITGNFTLMPGPIHGDEEIIFPLMWEIRYLDSTQNEQVVLVASFPNPLYM